MAKIDDATIDFKVELLRKSIHLGSLSIPIIYYFITKELAVKLLIPITIFSIFLDFGRYIFPTLGKLFYKLFGFMLRSHEMDQKKKNLSGATYVFISALLVILIFPKLFAILGLAVLIVGDISAALIGRKFGRHKFLAKSLEGTLAFFLSSVIVVFLTPKVEGNWIEYLIAIIAVGVAAIAENISYGYADDNFMIPLSTGITMWILYALLLPDLQIILPNVPQ